MTLMKSSKKKGSSKTASFVDLSSGEVFNSHNSPGIQTHGSFKHLGSGGSSTIFSNSSKRAIQELQYVQLVEFMNSTLPLYLSIEDMEVLKRLLQKKDAFLISCYMTYL